jgi:phosphoserine phosphatase RsbU/P
LNLAGLRAPSPTFASVLVATIDLESGELNYAAAGVEGGLVLGDRSTHVHLEVTGPLLGIEQNPTYEERTVRFLPGETLVAYTDGVTEAPAATLDERLGSYGLVRSMRRIQPAGELTIRAIWKEIDHFTGHVYHDDATLAIVTTKALKRASSPEHRTTDVGGDHFG